MCHSPLENMVEGKMNMKSKLLLEENLLESAKAVRLLQKFHLPCRRITRNIQSELQQNRSQQHKFMSLNPQVKSPNLIHSVFFIKFPSALRAVLFEKMLSHSCFRRSQFVGGVGGVKCQDQEYNLLLFTISRYLISDCLTEMQLL